MTEVEEVDVDNRLRSLFVGLPSQDRMLEGAVKALEIRRKPQDADYSSSNVHAPDTPVCLNAKQHLPSLSRVTPSFFYKTYSFCCASKMLIRTVPQAFPLEDLIVC